jgi:tetratricopeptide (TPR) repeat protein
MKKLLVFILLFVGFGLVQAQEADVAKSNGIMYEGQMQYQKAADAYALAEKLYAEKGVIDTLCVFKAGQNYVRLEQYEKAIPYLEKAAELKYADKNVFLSLADAYSGLKNYEAAEQALIKGLEIFPEEEPTYRKKLAYHYFNSKNFDEAVATIDLALELYPGDDNLMYLKGSALERNKKYDEAVLVFESILAQDPNHKKSITKLGVLKFKLTDYLYAKETKRYESMKNPTRVDYHNSKKKLEAISQGFNEAIPYLEKARTFKPNDKLVLNCLMVAYRRTNQTQKSDEIKALLD